MAHKMTFWESVRSGQGVSGWLAGTIVQDQKDKKPIDPAPIVQSAVSGTGVAVGLVEAMRQAKEANEKAKQEANKPKHEEPPPAPPVRGNSR